MMRRGRLSRIRTQDWLFASIAAVIGAAAAWFATLAQLDQTYKIDLSRSGRPHGVRRDPMTR
jgi:hypothetical protein